VRLRALHERAFRLLFTGQSLSLVGDGMVNVALPFAVLDLTGSVTDLGFVFAAFTLPLVAFLLVGDVLADRFQPRGVMLASDLIRFASQGAVAALLVSGHARIWELVVLQAVRGGAVAFFQPASTALTPSTVPPELLQEANALRGLSPGLVLGAAIAKRSLGGAGAWGLIVGAFGLGAVIGVVVALRIRPPRPLVTANLVLIGSAAPPALLALRPPLALVVAGACVGGIGGTVFNALWETALQRHIPAERLSRVTAYDWFVSTAANPLGQAVSGPAAGAIGIDTTLAVAAGWLAAAPFLTLAIPSIRHLRDGARPYSEVYPVR
jgi:MFS family permease